MCGKKQKLKPAAAAPAVGAEMANRKEQVLSSSSFESPTCQGPKEAAAEEKRSLQSPTAGQSQVQMVGLERGQYSPCSHSLRLPSSPSPLPPPAHPTQPAGRHSSLLKAIPAVIPALPRTPSAPGAGHCQFITAPGLPYSAHPPNTTPGFLPWTPLKLPSKALDLE